MEFRARVVYVAALVLALAARENAEQCQVPPGAEFELPCTLPGGTEIELTYRAGQYVTLECYGNGTYICTELPHIPPTSVPLSRAMLKNCALPVNESLTCTLQVLGVGTATSLTLRGVPGGAAAVLTPEHVQGLEDLATLTLLGSGPDSAYSHLPTAALAALPSLRRLTVREARLRLTPDSLAGVSRLEYLEISASHIKELNESVLRGLESLHTLNMWGNELSSLQNKSLEGLEALDTLDLSSNPLQTLGEDVLAAAKNLRVLKLVNTELSKLDEPALRALAALQELVVVDARKSLKVGSRSLALPKLRSVQLERCGLVTLPGDALADAGSLTSLSLAYNSLETLPAELLQDTVELRALNLSHNALKELAPALFKTLWNLEELKLDHNNLEKISDNMFVSLGKLRTLTARNNRLHELSPTALRGARKLQSLDLAHNELTLRGTEALVTAVTDGYAGFLGDGLSPMIDLIELQQLDLSHNLVQEVFYDWRNVLLNLKLLNLTHNQLEFLSDPDINFLSEDVTVDFRYNQIATIQISEGMQLARIDNNKGNAGSARILLDGNPFHCDCHMYTLVRLLKNSSYTHIFPTLKLDGAVCVNPPELTNVLLRSVPLDKLICAVTAPECPDSCECTLHFASNSIELDCIDTPLTVPAPSEFGVNRTVLRLRHAPPTLNLSLPVQELILSGLGLTLPPPGPAPPELELLDLSRNLLTEVPKALGPNKNYRLRLARNPLACDCAHSEALIALPRPPYRVEDWYNVTCVNGDLVRLKDTTGLCASARAAWAAGTGGVLAIIGLLITVLAVLWLRYQNEIKVYCFARGWCGCLTRDRKELPAKYDVFLSFSHKDEDVVVHKLVPELERRGYRLCVHYRDWAPGESIAEHVSRSVHEARRTLVVVSPGFLCSEWTRAEFRAAHARALREGRSRVIVVLLGELPAPDASAQDDDLRAYLRTNTYLKWGDTWFWEKLQYALPHHPLGDHKELLPPMSLSARTLSADALRAALEIHLQPEVKLVGGLEPRLLPPPPAL